MGETMQVPNTRAADTPPQAVQAADAPPHTPSSSSQPRKFDLLTESQSPATSLVSAPTAPQKADSSMRLEVGSYMNLPPYGPQSHPIRHDLTLFIFNPGRHDLIGQLLNMLPAAPTGASARSSAFPSYYIGHRDSVSGGVPTQDMPTRLRGDSIFLPPPMLSKLDSDTGVAVSTVSGVPPAPLRLNSIFSSLIQMPGSSSNSVSGQSTKEDDPKQDTNLEKAKDTEQHVPEVVAADNHAMKDSLSNIFGWNQDKLLGRNSKRADSISAFWEQVGSVSGLLASISPSDLNAFLVGLQGSGSIDFTNMSNEERRSSILKLIHTPHDGKDLVPKHGPPVAENNTENQIGQVQNPTTKLREYIFDKAHTATPVPAVKTEGEHISPTSSMSLKSSQKYNDGAHSPKTSPDGLPAIDLTSTLTLPPLRQYTAGAPSEIDPKQPSSFYKNVPVVPSDAYPFEGMLSYTNGVQKLSPALVPPPGGRVTGAYAKQAGFLPPVFKNTPFTEAVKSEYPFKQEPPPVKLGKPFEPQLDDKRLLPAQQHAQSEDGRPLLGATKVDQLMLVIQAREKGNTNAIKRAADGSILASPTGTDDKGVLPAAVNLVGGIEKPVKDTEKDSELGEKPKRRRGKTQQCPYCFKQFSQTTHLDVHVRSHIGYKPFQCTYCQKRFTQGGNLRTHMRLHTGEKPFKCDVCNRSFSRKGNLGAHMLTHNKEKPFECKLDGCDKSFTQLGNLKSHQNKFHLPTLNRLTQTLAELSGDELASLSDAEKELLDYFRNLYKNSNKGIRGRGKGKRVATVDELCDTRMTPTSSQTTPQHSSARLNQIQQMSPQSPVQLVHHTNLLGHQINYATPESQDY